jgi:hypothetical protein
MFSFMFCLGRTGGTPALPGPTPTPLTGFIHFYSPLDSFNFRRKIAKFLAVSKGDIGLVLLNQAEMRCG